MSFRKICAWSLLISTSPTWIFSQTIVYERRTPLQQLVPAKQDAQDALIEFKKASALKAEGPMRIAANRFAEVVFAPVFDSSLPQQDRREALDEILDAMRVMLESIPNLSRDQIGLFQNALKKEKSVAEAEDKRHRLLAFLASVMIAAAMADLVENFLPILSRMKTAADQRLYRGAYTTMERVAPVIGRRMDKPGTPVKIFPEASQVEKRKPIRNACRRMAVGMAKNIHWGLVFGSGLFFAENIVMEIFKPHSESLNVTDRMLTYLDEAKKHAKP